MRYNARAYQWVVPLCCAVALCMGCAATVPPTSLAGGEAGRISLHSLTLPTTSLLTLTKEGTDTVVWGDLRLPREATGPLPTVILLHGAGGVSPNLADWASELHHIGIATFVLDSFGGRGITETRTGLARINLGSRLVDVYRALELLATHPRLDPARIALMGFSQGGGVVLLARQTRFQQLWTSGERQFVAFLAFYPAGCNARLLHEDQVSAGPLRIFHGTADDQTIIEPCRAYVERLRTFGQDVALIEYPGARHAFDIRTLPPARAQQDVISGRNCVYVERERGAFEIMYRDTGQPAPSSEACLSRGITVSYQPRARQQAVQDVKALLSATFAMPR
jgi:dienelactone hydrolase